MRGLGEPASVWDAESVCCAECATPFTGVSCPNCGERVDASPVAHMAFVVERDDGPWLSLFAAQGEGMSLRGTRPITGEQARRLSR